MEFQEAYIQLLKHEGGYVDHPDDPGGATRYGVTEAVARRAGYTGRMQDLPLDVAAKIYRDLYWNTIRADDLPPALRYDLFDAAVNSGPGQAIKWLQRALGVKDDGVLGPQTLAAIRAANPDKLAKRMIGHRLNAMTDMKNWPSFSRGWARRIAALLVKG